MIQPEPRQVLRWPDQPAMAHLISLYLDRKRSGQYFAPHSRCLPENCPCIQPSVSGVVGRCPFTVSLSNLKSSERARLATIVFIFPLKWNFMLCFIHRQRAIWIVVRD
jgi:hypothetical protein